MVFFRSDTKFRKLIEYSLGFVYHLVEIEPRWRTNVSHVLVPSETSGQARWRTTVVLAPRNQVFPLPRELSILVGAKYSSACAFRAFLSCWWNQSYNRPRWRTTFVVPRSQVTKYSSRHWTKMTDNRTCALCVMCSGNPWDDVTEPLFYSLPFESYS